MLTIEQKQFIIDIDIDRRVKNILSGGGDEEKILINMYEYLPKIKTIIKSASKAVLDEMCCQYDGFCKLMELIEKLAKGIASGAICIPD